MSAPVDELMVLLFKDKLSTSNDVNVPTLVIAVCSAPVTVAAVPLTLPVTLQTTSPVKPPTNVVDVIEVAPVTTPASTLIVPSRTIAEPFAGARLSAPDDAVILLPSKDKLSTANAVNVPTLVIAV